MKRAIILTAMAFAVMAFLVMVAARRGDPDIAIERDLVYGKGADSELKLDLAVPLKGDGPFPAVVFLHGEGWRAGNRQQMSHFIEGMARLGYVGVTVEYRLVPAARFPAQLEDCKAAVRWLRANAQRYRIRSDRIGVVGFSAGGHLASMLGVTGNQMAFEGVGGNPRESSRVQAVVSFFGPTDFSTRDWPRDLEEQVIAPFLGGSFADKPDLYANASPVNHVDVDAPPFLFFHGTEDKLVPVDQSKRLARKLETVGVPTQMITLDREGHGFTDASNQRSMQQMLDFLGTWLKS